MNGTDSDLQLALTSGEATSGLPHRGKTRQPSDLLASVAAAPGRLASLAVRTDTASISMILR
jgi:hypothetical protein